jgi:hypothetical protein
MLKELLLTVSGGSVSQTSYASEGITGFRQIDKHLVES